MHNSDNALDATKMGQGDNDLAKSMRCPPLQLIMSCHLLRSSNKNALDEFCTAAIMLWMQPRWDKGTRIYHYL
ncbi:hypothetical protein P8452_14299 [Trifolium repens]|nr:hypothetical protein P8452_14299 [Trifolium repens]